VVGRVLVLGGGAHRYIAVEAGRPVNGGGVCGAVEPDARGDGAVQESHVPGQAIHRDLQGQEVGGWTSRPCVHACSKTTLG